MAKKKLSTDDLNGVNGGAQTELPKVQQPGEHTMGQNPSKTKRTTKFIGDTQLPVFDGVNGPLEEKNK